MLDYTTCCKLKVAGYPQPVDEHGQAKGQYHGSFVAGPECACPNSDELIAAIQQRFNVYPWLTTVPKQPCEAGAINEYEFDLDVNHGSTFITGDSPVAALAALYLALAGGE